MCFCNFRLSTSIQYVLERLSLNYLSDAIKEGQMSEQTPERWLTPLVNIAGEWIGVQPCDSAPNTNRF